MILTNLLRASRNTWNDLGKAVGRPSAAALKRDTTSINQLRVCKSSGSINAVLYHLPSAIYPLSSVVCLLPSVLCLSDFHIPTSAFRLPTSQICPLSSDLCPLSSVYFSFADCSRACSRTLAPASQSSHLVFSTSTWLRPPMLGTNTMAVGHTWFM
jgi:hypothetical protein